METQSRTSVLRLATNASLIVGASCSMVAIFIIGSRQRSVLLMTMFLVFVLASALKYVSVVVWPVKAQPASTFLMVPIASWALFAFVAVLATRASRKT
ncbi:hypothetical protein BH09GEM1_BH09GEM1_40680 [soil metagenome]